MNALKRFSKQFTDEKIKDVIKIKREYFLVSEELQEFNKDWLNSNVHTVFSPRPGILLGMVKKEKFYPSLYFLELLSNKSTNKIFINEKASWLFICGRDVFEENILKNNSTSDIFLVQNPKDENLGLGRMKKKGKKSVVMNLIDRGDYLRREMSKK